MRSGPEIQEALRKFAAKWSTYQGSERAEAQTFLNELFACYGTDRSEVGALFGAFADLRELQRKLDLAVAAAYGWPASIAQDGPEIVRRLTELNRQISEGERSYHPFATAEPPL